MIPGRANLRRACLLVAAVAALWMPIAAVTGGFRFEVAGVTISARGFRNPILLVILGVVAAAALSPRRARVRTVRADAEGLFAAIQSIASAPAFGRWASAACATTAAAAVVVAAITYGAFVAGGSDSYGYVSQARLWATSIEPVPDAMMTALERQPYHREVFVPLGWRPAQSGNAMVPSYAPGLPLVMSLFERVGGPAAVFYVVPLLGAMAIGATFLLGRAVGGAPVGAVAAVLLASSPSFLAFVTAAPMSDVPAAAWWTLMLALLTIERPTAFFGAGIAAGLAILTRPNLLPLVVPAAAWVMRPLLQARLKDSAAWLRTVLFAAGSVAGCLAVAALFTYWYGSATQPGYGQYDLAFSWSYWRPNVAHWSEWLAATQTPLIALAVAGPLVAVRSGRRTGFVVTLCVFVLAVVASYLFYYPFDEWLYLRFLLPAFPVVMTFFAAVLVAAARRLRWAPAVHTAMVLTVGLLAWHGVTDARERLVFDRGGDAKYPSAGRYIADHLPSNAAILAVQHSGSARYYSGRPTLRWDWLDPGQLDTLIDDLRAIGYEPFYLIEDWEIAGVRTRFPGSPRLAPFDAPPIAQTAAGSVRVYSVDAQDPTFAPALIDYAR